MFVYVIVNLETQKIYVGQHKGNNLQKYLQTKQSNARRNSGTRSHLFAAMRKHPEGWSIHPLVSCIEDKKELDETEQLLIYALKAQHPGVGYNICDGGEGFTGPHREETKRKISEHHKGINYRYVNGYVPQSQDEIERRREKCLGQKRTPEQCQRISAAKRERGHGIGQTHQVSESARKNIGEKNKAGWTPERRAAWSEYKKAHPTGIAVKKFAEPDNAARQV